MRFEDELTDPDSCTSRLIQFTARRLCRLPGFNRSDQPDLEQEIWLYVLANMWRFDPARASLRTFITRLVETAFGLILRRVRRLKRGPGQGPQSLDSAFTEGRDPCPLCEALTESDLHRRTGASSRTHEAAWNDGDAIGVVLDSLCPELKTLCELLLAGGTPESARRELGLSRRAVRRSIESLRERFWKAGLGNL